MIKKIRLLLVSASVHQEIRCSTYTKVIIPHRGPFCQEGVFYRLKCYREWYGSTK